MAVDREDRAARRVSDEGLLLGALDHAERVEELGRVLHLDTGGRGGERRGRAVRGRALDADGLRPPEAPGPPGRIGSSSSFQVTTSPTTASRRWFSASKLGVTRTAGPSAVRISAVSRSLRPIERFAAQARFREGVTKRASRPRAFAEAARRACLSRKTSGASAGGSGMAEGAGSAPRGRGQRIAVAAVAAVPAATQPRRVMSMRRVGYRAPCSLSASGGGALPGGGRPGCGELRWVCSDRGRAGRRDAHCVVRGGRGGRGPVCGCGPGSSRGSFRGESFLTRGELTRPARRAFPPLSKRLLSDGRWPSRARG